MSSSFKLMLRPPPHVEFLQGYPGIAPHGERKSALVQGTLEVRGAAKAKWIRVELRKIEILPGGGQNNTFAETIGDRPITLWSSPQDDFTELSSNDFPFHINIPEAVPPSIALERGAAIKYELIASVMLKGKKSFFRRDPAPITTFTAPIVIEKYNLLQTWPIYATRHSQQARNDDVTLVANFHQCAFGPGDVVPVEAVLRAEVPGQGVILRAYELTVRETLIFRSNPPPPPQHHHHLHVHSQPPAKKVSAVQTRSNIISDQKVPVPVQVLPGSQHRCDLGCHIPLSQTNVSVNTARHIEVNYVVQVKAVFANDTTISVDLPVTITNWQRQASQDTMSRIGYAPELIGGSKPQSAGSAPSLFQATSPPPNGNNQPGSNGAPSSVAGSIPERVSRRSTTDRNTINALPNNIVTSTDDIDELGYVPAHGQLQSQSMPPGRASNQGGPGGREGQSEPEGYFGDVGPLNSSPMPGAVPRPHSSSNRRTGAQQRFTVVNVDEPEKHLSAEEEKRLLQEKYANQEEQRRKRRSAEAGSSARPANGTPISRPGTANSKSGAWPTAEEEKKRLYDQARQTATKTQQSAGYSTDTYADDSSAPASSQGTPGAGGSKGESTKKEKSWPSAEEEKRRLFENARKAAQQTQQAAFDTTAPYADEYTPSPTANGGTGFAGGWRFSAGGPLDSGLNGGSGVPYGAPAPVESAPYAQEPQPASQQWLSAADEKRMLFEKARAAAERTQMQAASSPPPIEAPTPTYGPTPAPYGEVSPRSNSVLSGSSGQPITSPIGFNQQGYSPMLGHNPAGAKSGEELYASGLAAIGRQSMYNAPQMQTYTPQPPRVATPPYAGSGGSSLGHSPSQRRFPSASEEKAALAYMAAKQRVEQAWANEGAGGSAAGYTNGETYSQSPTVPSYDTLYAGAAPPPPASPTTHPLSVHRGTPSAPGTPPPTQDSWPPMPQSDLPPGFTPDVGPTTSALSALEEKARLRRQYAEQDATAGSAGNLAPPAFQATAPPAASLSARDEKERMRQMYAEQDVAATRPNEYRAASDGGRRANLPMPPGASEAPAYEADANGSGPPPFASGFMNSAGSNPLSAVEEKARLRAQYEAEANGYTANYGGSSAEPPPPAFDSHYQPQSPPQNLSAPNRSTAPTPEPVSSRGGLQRDPTISQGKRRAPQTPDEPLPRSTSGFVAPPPPPPLMPKPPAAYIQETIATDAAVSEWDHTRPVTPDAYDIQSNTLGSPAPAPPIPPKPST